MPPFLRSPAVRRVARLIAAGLGLLLLALPLLTANAFYTHLAVMMCLNVVIVSGMSMLSRSGQLSLCHAAFVGIGAYGSVLLAGKLGLGFLAAAAAGVLGAAAVALALGAAILRLRGVYFVLITFAFGELFRLALLEGATLTGGANGIAGIPPARLLGLVFDSRKSFYLLALAIAALSMLLLALLFRSPKGHALDAVGDNATLAEASGISARGTQLFAFTLGAAIAGLGGVLLAHYVGYISPESFNTQLSISTIILLVVGGRASTLGPLIGSVVMTPLPELFRGAVQTQNIFYGVTLILILRYLPLGIASLPVFAWRRAEVRP